jgi:hypothetical protein
MPAMNKASTVSEFRMTNLSPMSRTYDDSEVQEASLLCQAGRNLNPERNETLLCFPAQVANVKVVQCRASKESHGPRFVVEL